jgi:addiction module HigA family antidote
MIVTATRRRRPPRPPGALLRTYWLAPRGITVSALAKATGLTRKHVSNVVNDRAPITAPTAVRLGRALGTSADLWLNLQRAVDLWHAERDLPAGAVTRLIPASSDADTESAPS